MKKNTQITLQNNSKLWSTVKIFIIKGHNKIVRNTWILHSTVSKKNTNSQIGC